MASPCTVCGKFTGADVCDRCREIGDRIFTPPGATPWPCDTRYSVTEDGVVYGIRGQALKSRDQKGYRVVGLSKNGATRPYFVHRLVLATFVGPCPDGQEVLHGNGIRDDNRLCNLRYGTRKENMEDCSRHGNQYMASRTHCKYGHEFTPENTRIHPGRQGNGPFRLCRECKRLRQIRYRAEYPRKRTPTPEAHARMRTPTPEAHARNMERQRIRRAAVKAASA